MMLITITGVLRSPFLSRSCMLALITRTAIGSKMGSIEEAGTFARQPQLEPLPVWRYLE
jgi:hypothetical protein